MHAPLLDWHNPHWSICSNLAPTTLPNLSLTFSTILCTWTCWKPNMFMSGNFTNTLHGAWWEPNLPTYKKTASIWAEHNPNSTNPWCSSHTHPFLTSSFLHLSCKNSQENMSASPCSSNEMFFHLLMLLCACTNLDVMIEILLKTLSFSEHQHLEYTRPSCVLLQRHGPPRREIV